MSHNTLPASAKINSSYGAINPAYLPMLVF